MSKVCDTLNHNIKLLFTTSATNYEFSGSNIDAKLKPIFEHYDSNKDNVLQKEELTKLMLDIQSANNDQYQDYFSKKEAENYLSNTIKNAKISVKNLNAFVSNIINDYKLKIQNEANGDIEFFEQGDRGDCWLLSQLNSLSQTTWGKEAIKNSVIKNQDTNSYTIRFAGVNFETTITQEDIKKAREQGKYSKGDLDVLLFEIATERYFEQEKALGDNLLKAKEDVLEGSCGVGKKTLFYLLTGKMGHSFCRIRMSEEDHRVYMENYCRDSEVVRYNTLENQNNFSNAYDRNTMLELINKISENEDIAITCFFENSDNWENNNKYTKRQKKDYFSNADRHAFVIKNISRNENGEIVDIELSNPWYIGIPIHKTLDEFLDQMETIQIVTNDDNYDYLKTGFKPCLKIE